MEIDNRNIFFDNLRNGINLFTGAGFSKLESPDGKILPDAKDLSDQICKDFSISAAYSNDLGKISTILKRNDKDRFQKYLREKFEVHNYNKLYDILDKIMITSFITTNIDNIFASVIDNSKEHYLNCISRYGATKKNGQSIEFIPLHGDIKDLNSELYFGNFELCNVDATNHALFSSMERNLQMHPTLFWGYGFHDGSVLKVLDNVLTQHAQDIWIQCLPENESIEFFRSLGCNVIIATTEELLYEISNELMLADKNTSNNMNIAWDKYRIPTDNKVESLPIKDYYQLGKTHWYYVITNQAYTTNWVNTIINYSLKNNNVMLVGSPLGGKTTLLMQVARKYNKPVYYIFDLNFEKAKLLCNTIDKDDEKILIIDNCTEDITAYHLLASKKNIKTIASCDDFMYESTKHLIEDITYKKIIMEDIDKEEALRIFNNIPNNIRNETFKYKINENDKYSFFELITTNIQNVLSFDKVRDFIHKIENNDEVFEIILLTAYLVYHKSVLSTDILFKYFDNIDTYEDVQRKIRKAQSLLAEINITFQPDLDDQDYYVLRSNLFATMTHEVAKKHYKDYYARVIKTFIGKTPPNYIYKNYIFKRQAYDAELFNILFGHNGDDIYEMIYANDHSAYTLQQWALYKAKDGRYLEAFALIDKALNILPNNFSIKNARAIILFEANKDKDTEEAKRTLYEAMEILENCYKSDKRKVYHAQKYAEFAIYIYKSYRNKAYFAQARDWIKELIDTDTSKSYKTKRLYKELTECID